MVNLAKLAKLAKEKKEKAVKPNKQTPVPGTVEETQSVKQKEKVKEKENKEPKDPKKHTPHGHDRKKKKGRTASIGGSSHLSSEENLSHAGSHDFGADGRGKHARGQRTMKKSKMCEEAVNKAVNDFWDTAWHICADRFFVTSAPISVCLELRNTWLRIVESEWQDLDMAEHKMESNRPNRIFMHDDPPLPLAFDSWSRGAMEQLPKNRRESVLDPFLRDTDVFGRPLDQSDEGPDSQEEKTTTSAGSKRSVAASTLPHPASADLMSLKTPDQKSPPSKVSTRPSSVAVEQAYSQWDFSLDNKIATDNPMMQVIEEVEQKRKTLMMEQEQKRKTHTEQELKRKTFLGDQQFPMTQREESTSTKKSLLIREDFTSSSTKTLNSQSTGGLKSEDSAGSPRESVMLIMPARVISDDSTETDGEYSAGGPKLKPRKSQDRFRFSPSQCGGPNGSGIFRMPNETTSEALLKMQLVGSDRRIIGHHVTSLIDNESNHPFLSIVVPGRGLPKIDGTNGEEFAVQPLFEERHSYFATEDSPSLIELKARIRTSIAADFHSLSSKKEKQFMQRKMAHLKDKYKRQTMKFLATKANIRNTQRRMSERAGSVAKGPYDIDNGPHSAFMNILQPERSSNHDSIASLESRLRAQAEAHAQAQAKAKNKNHAGPVRQLPYLRSKKVLQQQQNVQPVKPSFGRLSRAEKRHSIETRGRKVVYSGEGTQRGSSDGSIFATGGASDTCLYMKRPVEEFEQECYPKNDFARQHGLCQEQVCPPPKQNLNCSCKVGYSY